LLKIGFCEYTHLDFFIINMVKYIFYSLFTVSLAIQETYSQSSFSFLNTPIHAQMAALGGNNVSSKSIGSFTENPALLDATFAQKLSVGYNSYSAGIAQLSTTYSITPHKHQHWGIALRNFNYGEMPLTDPTGNVMGTFKSQDNLIQLSHARKEGNISIGASLKLANSSIETYQSTALLFDMGAVFEHPTKDLRFGFCISNVGKVLRTYTTLNTPDLPLNLLAGISYKAKYMPFRFSLTAQHLHEARQLSKHLILGTEILFSKHFQANIGYSPAISSDMQVSSIQSVSGFSMGVSTYNKWWGLQYAYRGIFAGMGLHYFTFVIDTKQFLP
jgi:hypothetical protein